jgi:transmembrane sensor
MEPFNSEERYQELAAKWLDNTISEEERNEFSSWYNTAQDRDFNVPQSYAGSDQEIKERIYANIDKTIGRSAKIVRFTKQWVAAAAVVLLILSTGLYFFKETVGAKIAVVKTSKPDSESVVPKNTLPLPSIANKQAVVAVKDIIAGDDKAILTLGDGTKIILDDARNGILANQGGNSILKTAEGELIYSFSSPESETATATNSETLNFNTIETPKGGKFQVRLPDGSKVWLNAASSLRFPTAFTGSKREVELKGEAYFEVAHDLTKIFEVTTRNQTVQVLGTHFNINAYADEPTVNTTLLEGSVRISDLRTNNSQLLKPGEQAKLSENIEVVNVKNTTESVAWKDGYFQFEDADIETVMRQIERWYDVTVRYEEQLVPTQRFGGEIERSLSLLQVLKVLEKTKVHFRLEGREVIVMR